VFESSEYAFGYGELEVVVELSLPQSGPFLFSTHLSLPAVFHLKIDWLSLLAVSLRYMQPEFLTLFILPHIAHGAT